jgi:hypothetical protein
MGLTEEIASITSKLGTLTEQVTEILRTGIHILSKVRKILQKKVKCLKHKCLRQKKIIKKLTKKTGKVSNPSVCDNQNNIGIDGKFWAKFKIYLKEYA